MALTPGSSRARWMILKISRRASAGSFFTKVKSISVTRSPAATNPGFNPAAFIARRKESAEASHPRRFTDLLFQIVNQIGLRRFKCGTEAEERSRDQTKHERHREHGEVRREIDNEREVDVV